MDKNGKSRHSVWLSDDVWQEVADRYEILKHILLNFIRLQMMEHFPTKHF